MCAVRAAHSHFAILALVNCVTLRLRAQAAAYSKCVNEFSAHVDFVTIYVEEAHASDEWGFASGPQLAQARSLSERLQAARLFLNETPSFDGGNLWVDGMDNAACIAYAALPERLYVIQDGVCACVEACHVTPTLSGRGGYSTIVFKCRVCACAKRTAAAARESLRRDCFLGLTWSAFHACQCGSASPFCARCCHRK